MRRAAAKCMAALIGSRPDLLPDFHRTLAPALIHRFKEREENVKADVFGAYIVLLRQMRPPKGWMGSMEEPTQTGISLHALHSQVGMPPSVSHPRSPTQDSPSHPSTFPSFRCPTVCPPTEVCALSPECPQSLLGAEAQRGPWQVRHWPVPHRLGTDRRCQLGFWPPEKEFQFSSKSLEATGGELQDPVPI